MIAADTTTDPRREQWRETIALAARLEDERPAILAAMQAAEAALADAYAEHKATVGKLSARLEQVEQAAFQASLARGELSRSAPDRLRQAAKQASFDAAACGEAIAKAVRELENQRAVFGTATDAKSAKEYQARVDRAAAKLADLERQRAALVAASIAATQAAINA